MEEREEENEGETGRGVEDVGVRAGVDVLPPDTYITLWWNRIRFVCQ